MYVAFSGFPHCFKHVFALLLTTFRVAANGFWHCCEHVFMYVVTRS
ncbi:hypothetical protein HMPREF9144_2025 [Prevotella pallens ATCC 700821]|uniref:Uncharacterized protein n=1 Tax=Prevotella pallens ATCC 700821 TaxID=997353 RepID=F9DK33_9BACT|nr:hypothetical protein HMPREF9144_2025 [Prevotella pallens ATCC 700821]